MNDIVLSCKGLHKTFHEGDLKVPVLKGIDFAAAEGESVAIVGASGSGKSTFLHLLGGLDTPTQGVVLVAGTEMNRLSEAARGRLRSRTLGFIYQFHHLLPEFTALENVCLPMLIAGFSRREAKERGRQLLSDVGLGERIRHKPGELSGGERQRAAVARALVTEPRCVLADEPTGNLDKHTAHQVFDLMMSINAKVKSTLVIVTHDFELAQRTDRILRLDDGILGAAA